MFWYHLETDVCSLLLNSNDSLSLCRAMCLRYVDVILQLIEKAGDFVSDDIWYRVVQFVTNNDDLQVFHPQIGHNIWMIFADTSGGMCKLSANRFCIFSEGK